MPSGSPAWPILHRQTGPLPIADLSTARMLELCGTTEGCRRDACIRPADRHRRDVVVDDVTEGIKAALVRVGVRK